MCAGTEAGKQGRRMRNSEQFSLARRSETNPVFVHSSLPKVVPPDSRWGNYKHQNQ